MSKFNIFLRLRATEEEEADMVVQNNTLMAIHPKTLGTHQYEFDEIFPPETSQAEVCDTVFKPLLESHVLKFENCLLFAYGVTGSGKTHTITGTPNQPGIVPRVFNELFEIIESYQNYSNNIYIENNLPVMDSCSLRIKDSIDWKSISSKYRREHSLLWRKWKDHFDPSVSKPTEDNEGVTYNVFLNYVEVYNNQVYDLFDFPPDHRAAQWSRRPLQNRIDFNKRNFMENSNNMLVVNAWDAMKIFLLGNMNRHSTSTNLNRDSSRSHCILTIKLFKIENLGDGRHHVRESHFSIVDLAGVERLSRTTNQGKTVNETNSINLSLMALRNCFQMFKDKANDTPNQKKCFSSSLRQNKLTVVLKDLLENTSTNISMIVCMNPSQNDFADNYHVLDFAKDCITIDWSNLDNINYEHVNDFILDLHQDGDNNDQEDSDEQEDSKKRNIIEKQSKQTFKSNRSFDSHKSCNMEQYHLRNMNKSFVAPSNSLLTSAARAAARRSKALTWYEKVRAEYMTPKNVKHHQPKLTERSLKFKELVKFWKKQAQQTPVVTPMIGYCHKQRQISGGIKHRTVQYMSASSTYKTVSSYQQGKYDHNINSTTSLRIKLLNVASKIQTTIKKVAKKVRRLPFLATNVAEPLTSRFGGPVDWNKRYFIAPKTPERRSKMRWNFSTCNNNHNKTFSNITQYNDMTEKLKALRTIKKNRIKQTNIPVLKETVVLDDSDDSDDDDDVTGVDNPVDTDRCSKDSFKLHDSSDDSDIEVSLPDSTEDFK